MAYQFKRIAVKIGSNVLTRKDGSLDVTRMSALVDQVAELHRKGVEVVLISSGAVASGRSEVKPGKKLDAVSARQLYSAVGQAKLITVTSNCSANIRSPAARCSLRKRISVAARIISTRNIAWK